MTDTQPIPDSRMRVVVDLNRCEGYGQCCFATPDHFWMRGPEGLSYHPMPDGADRHRILSAAAACPVRAIHVEDVVPT